ncbi:MAG: AAA domain-containing protein [Gemmatimonadetes bacterium]|nr:AAA domain-containing protein [Gemmatimonadota bacterium]
MKKVLLCWIGATDLRASQGDDVGEGPIAQAVEKLGFDEVFLISNYLSDDRVTAYVEWAKKRSSTPYRLYEEELSSPTHFGEIYEAAVRICTAALDEQRDQVKLTFHLSPGTPAMAAVWILLAKTRFSAELIESSREYGVQTASIPFDISAEFLPDFLLKPDEQLRSISADKPIESANFADIHYRSPIMAHLVEKAQRIALRNVPVLLEGESGTGKELFAHAIHQHSPRSDKPFVAVNCGAIPESLVESELFGSGKGAFTGANAPRKGHFESANGGTIFLDEIGELPKDIQVKLLRVLEEREVVRLGTSKSISVDVRIVAATNRTLSEEVREGRFREDLFYRIVVAYLKLPPLRERPGDLGLLIDHSIEKINRESEGQPGYQRKKISAGAKNIILNHDWPGNIRELQNTLIRAMVWTDGEILKKQDIEEALLPIYDKEGEDILNRPLDGDFSLPDLISEVARHYLQRAEEESKTKIEAAKRLGFSSHQTLNNWKKKHKV